ncbi:GPI-anchored protein LLG1-like [Mangifera indica]|uniref:GPI-anchored protein LLG1-like n=1 Tax=Mangifera indica TaxID=29780 RepID=UPI001CFA881E|nr:GPI-anchored protein LLG1-like [Mangifera indica]
MIVLNPETKILRLPFVKSEDQLVDLLTKAVLVRSFIAHLTSWELWKIIQVMSLAETLVKLRMIALWTFKSLDFTILTSQCKGPNFAAASCCKAFKEYACHYADAINDSTTDCATVLFNYIREMGYYHPGR